MTVWSELDHPNILQFLGIVTDIGNFLQIVSSWQDNGNLLEYAITPSMIMQEILTTLTLAS